MGGRNKQFRPQQKQQIEEKMLSHRVLKEWKSEK